MRINFDQLIKDSGEKLSKYKLAKEMSEAGLFKNRKSAYDMLLYNNSGKAKSVDKEMVKYLAARFDKKESEVIQWD